MTDDTWECEHEFEDMGPDNDPPLIICVLCGKVKEPPAIVTRSTNRTRYIEFEVTA